MERIWPYVLLGAGILGGGFWAVNQGAEETAEVQRREAQAQAEFIDAQKKNTLRLVEESLGPNGAAAEFIHGPDTFTIKRVPAVGYKAGVKAPEDIGLYEFDPDLTLVSSTLVPRKMGKPIDYKFGQKAEKLSGLTIREKITAALQTTEATEFKID